MLGDALTIIYRNIQQASFWNSNSSLSKGRRFLPLFLSCSAFLPGFYTLLTDHFSIIFNYIGGYTGSRTGYMAQWSPGVGRRSPAVRVRLSPVFWGFVNHRPATSSGVNG